MKLSTFALPALTLALALTGCSGLGGGADAGPTDAGAPDASLALPLNQVNATIAIVHGADDTSATCTANLVTSAGAKVVLKTGQQVQIGPVGGTTPTTLAGPDANGAYAASLPAGDAYDLTVREPTRGVVTTTVHAPAHFTITAPGSSSNASLSGFTLAWSGGEDGGVAATLTLSQAGASAPFTKELDGDPGSYTFSATDLQNFSQGTPMTATVTKHTAKAAVQGFAAGTASVERSANQALTPGP